MNDRRYIPKSGLEGMIEIFDGTIRELESEIIKDEAGMITLFLKKPGYEIEVFDGVPHFCGGEIVDFVPHGVNKKNGV